MTHFQVYLIMIANSVIGLCVIATLISAIIAFVLTINYFAETGKFWVSKMCALLTIFFLLISVLTPSTKDIAVIYALPKIMANEDVQELPADIVKLARQKIESMLEGK